MTPPSSNAIYRLQPDRRPGGHRMSAEEMNVARYIRERSEELKRLSSDDRLDVLSQIFGVAALEATKHEGNMLPQAIPPRGEPGYLVAKGDDDRDPRRAALQEILEG